jgi:dipeptidyl aminopeptidase/acylaminoacyl peptidase
MCRTSLSVQRAGLLVVLCSVIVGGGGGCAQIIADQILIPPRFAKRHAALAERRVAYAKRLGDRLKPVWCESFDGTKLAGLIMFPKPPADGEEAKEPAGIVFVLHGLTDRKEAMLDVAESYCDAGYIAVLPDLRAHGESGGRYTTLGFWERRDMSAFADYLGRKGYDVSRVGVLGGSLGAAVAIQWAASDPRVKAVVAVAPFADLRTELNYLYSKFDIGRLKQQILESATQEAARFRIPDVSPLKSLGQIETPIYLAHGWNDDIIPSSESRRLFYAAKGPVVLETVESNHMKIREALGRKFMKRSVEWMDVYLSGRSAVTAPTWIADYANRNFEDQAPVVVKEGTEIANPAPATVNP